MRLSNVSAKTIIALCHVESLYSLVVVKPVSLGQYDAILSQEINVSLADRTNGRAYATVLRPSVVCRPSSSSSVTLCIVAKRCVSEQKLLLRAYRKSYMRNRIGTKMNDLDLCLEVV